MSSEQPDIDLFFKPNIIGSSKRLVISKGFISLNSISKNENQTRISRQEIRSYRFGIKWLTGYKFTIGREYQIFIKDSADKVHKISFKSLYGYKKVELNQYFNTIIQSLWNFYFKDLVYHYIELINEGKAIDISGVRITDKYVVIKTRNLLKGKHFSIPWKDVGTKDYATYYAIFSNENPADINCGYNYLNDWDVALLYSIIETLKKHYANGKGFPTSPPI